MTARPELVLRGGTVYDHDGPRVRDLVLDGPVVAADPAPANEGAARIVDASGCAVLPGFIDLQVNGAVGVDLSTRPEALADVASFLPQCGVTTFMPTVISGAADDMLHALRVLSTTRSPPPGARVLGVHLEGPFLASSRAGAHPRHHVRMPSMDEIERWCIGHPPAMVTLAPELPGAVEATSRLDRLGVVVCAGHTDAGPTALRDAAAAGLRGVTHLFNAMGTMSARQPGPAGTVLGDDGGVAGTLAGLIAGLIVDGIHVDPSMVRLAWRVLGPHRTALVTDCMAAAGLGHGTFTIGETPVRAGSGGARTNSGALAGSVLRMDEAVRNLVSWTACSLAEASLAASATPARLARRPELGRLSSGHPADVVLLDDALRVVLTIVAGRVAFDRDRRCPPCDQEQPWKS